MTADRGWARRALLIANPQAGGRERQPVDEVAEHCARLVPHLDVVLTGYPGHAEKSAAAACETAGSAAGSAAGVDAVVVLGGDGTTREVASGLARAERERSRRPAMLSLPFGTGNSFYREIWADAPWQRVVTEALGGAAPRLRRVDMAHIRETGALALLGAGAGLIADALEVAQRLSGVRGRDRYQRAVAELMSAYTPYEGRVTVDGAVVHEGPVTLVNVGGGRYRAGRFELLPHSVVDDGLLDVCVVGGEMGVRELAGLTHDGGHLGRPGVVYRTGTRCVVERTDGRPLSFEHDGELCTAGSARYTVDILRGVLPVLSPAVREPGR